MLQEEPAWKSLYIAAIFETDKLKLQERVLCARHALLRHLRTLPDTQERRGERDRIEYALAMLDLLLRAQKPPPADAARRLANDPNSSSKNNKRGKIEKIRGGHSRCPVDR
jgi:hypothetical protein